MSQRALLLFVPFVLVLAGLALQTTTAQAATFDVNTTADGFDFDPGNGVCSINPPAQPIVCTLRAAVQQANNASSGPGPHTINLPANASPYVLTLGGTVPLSMIASMSILGGNEATTIIDGAGFDETIIGICATCAVSFSNLTVRNSAGLAVLHGTGGSATSTVTMTNVTLHNNRSAIDTRGKMILTNVTVRDNGNPTTSAVAGILVFGGGSEVTATNLTVSGNRSGSGVAGIRTDNGGFPPGGTLTFTGGSISSNESNGGPAGGLATSGGNVSLTNVTVSGNTNVGNGPAQFGIVGGINVASAALSLNNVVLTNNQVTGTPGDGTVGGLLYSGGTFTMNGGSVVGNGGAGANVGGIVYGGTSGTITGTPIQNNTGNAQDATVGGTGGIRVTGNGLSISDLTISGNTGSVNNGAAGVNVGGSLGTLHTIARITISGNNGPGIRLGNANVTNVTVSGNTGNGVTYFETQGTASFTNLTIANNGGAGIQSIDTSFNLLPVKSTLIASNVGGNCNTPPSSLLNSQGSNLSSDTTCVTSFNQPGDQNNVNPLLGPLANNGGPTLTQALTPGSPAIDGVLSGCPPPATDQRGVTRPQGVRCDIGAYEAPPPCTPRPPIGVATTPNGAGGLLVTVTANNNASVANNVISTLRFGEARPSLNALIDVEGQTNRSGTFSVAMNPPRSPVTFTIHRQQPTGGATANFVVVDNCGDWQTLAGGGASAFGSGDAAVSPPSAPTPTPQPPLLPPTPQQPPATTNVPTATPAPAPACTPRPPVVVATAPDGGGRLRVTVSASGTANTLQTLRFGTATNARIEAGSQGGSSSFSVALPPDTRQTSFTIGRVTPGEATTVNLVVVDGCGEWPTVLGGGAAAF